MSGGVAKCYAFSRLQENIGLGNLPAIRHVKCADAVIVDDYPLGGDAVLLFSKVFFQKVIFVLVSEAGKTVDFIKHNLFQKIQSDVMGGGTLAATKVVVLAAKELDVVLF